MQSWTSELGAVIQQLAGNPGSAIEKGVILFAGFVTCAVVHLLAAKMLRMTMVNVGRASAVMVICILVALVAATAARLYLVPRLEAGGFQPFVGPAVALVAVLAIVVPVACLVEHGNYLQGLSAILLAVAAACFVGFLVNAGFGAASQGGKETDRIRGRKRDIEKLLHTAPAPQPTIPGLHA